MRLAQALGLLLAGILFWLVVSTPLELEQQALFSLFGFLLALALSRLPGRLVTMGVIALSLTASTRYVWWRFTSTTSFDNWADLFFGTGLLLAEGYAFLVLLLGYVQTAWPLERKPLPLPADTAGWPSIDIFIPTYNEPLGVVRPTVFAALAIDWPREKLNIYVLDDGRRAEFAEFCAAAGVRHLTRGDNRHAKAGNINAALQSTHGDYIAIFDCDHIPTRSFLQTAMGWFLRDPKLAMLQTPHHFFSPDPFEKNLSTFKRVPNEGELFYGLVQDGNDLWNATFFCGSCAVIKRGPLLEVGGVAVETVTEDAHTALKLHRRGYGTAYLALPQAAGLATESLSGHVGQRIRWARGMAQIFRVDNPLLGPGLTLGQRLCYLNAMMHFFYGLPRLVFLTAPLAYLFLEAHVIQASALLIAAYSLPHLLHSNLTNTRMQGRFRHSFWNEVYESVLAWYILRPTLLAVINPRLGKFNVTPKGGVIESEYFDYSIARPYLILLALNSAGLAVGVGRLLHWNTHEALTVVLNLIWTVYNLVIIGASIAVALEVRQLRQNPRVTMRTRAALRFEDGRTLVCETSDFSLTGVGLRLPGGPPAPPGTPVQLTLFQDDQECVVPARIAHWSGPSVAVALEPLDVAQEFDYVRFTFSRADAWVASWGTAQQDVPARALRDVLGAGMRGISKIVHYVGADLRRHLSRDRNRLRPAKQE
ncbi:UDP-forming cellulose synthase catalytic subunit [Caldimonas tepidiphila]|uniref:UDP-forming cellulose synthase catalytic subunit n=1 Tax=Caldimonas tepidiphila TaxID=2315841 RepID=UPI001F0C45B0|nr:UDP-forming cellulose synthase catalytic subunit [Caldimonas tepidiphila]